MINNEGLRKADVIVCLEGDSYNRLPETAKLFKEGWSQWIIISGGYNNPPFSIPSKELKIELIKLGVPSKQIIVEDKSQNTHEQAVQAMKIIKKREWGKIILVTSHYHQLRAYLTFLKVMNEFKMKVSIYNAPVRNLSWYQKTIKQKNRLQLFDDELNKIDLYLNKNHISSFKTGLKYQEWKEKQK